MGVDLVIARRMCTEGSSVASIADAGPPHRDRPGVEPWCFRGPCGPTRDGELPHTVVSSFGLARWFGCRPCSVVGRVTSSDAEGRRVGCALFLECLVRWAVVHFHNVTHHPHATRAGYRPAPATR